MPTTPDTTWCRVFRDGFAPQLTTDELESLAVACETDDPRLIQGGTTTPPPLMCMQGAAVEAGCALGFVGAIRNGGFGAATVGQCEQVFADLCHDAGERVGVPDACRFVLNWWDDNPRLQVFREFLSELRAEIGRRQREQVQAT